MGLETGAILAISAAITTTAGVASAIEQREAGKRAERRQEEANEISRASAQVANARRRRQAIAQARIAQAQNVAAQGGEIASSSPLAGVQAGITSTLGANISEQRAAVQNQQAIFGFQQRAQDAIRRGQERADIFDVAGDISRQAVSFGTGSATPGTSFGN